MDGRPRTKAAKKRIARIKDERRLKKTRSKVMPMLSRPMLLRVNKKKPGQAKAKAKVPAIV